jgi:hypothetical protein
MENKQNFQKNWEWWHSWGLLLLMFIFPALAYYKLAVLTHSWLVFMAGTIIGLFLVGHGVTGSWKGAFVDNRNVVSLSRLQMIAWTILILTAFSSSVLWNIYRSSTPVVSSCPESLSKTDDPKCRSAVDIGLPPELWLLMGISTASLVGSPLILYDKKKLQPNMKERNQTFELLSEQGYDQNKLDHQGLLVVNESPKHARWSDLFTGEEVGNFAHVDIARLQMFFFTIVSIFVYGVALWVMLEGAVTTAPIAKFPILPDGLLALIGISHTGYLAAKATTKSQIGNDQTGASSNELSSNTIDDNRQAVG